MGRIRRARAAAVLTAAVGVFGWGCDSGEAEEAPKVASSQMVAEAALAEEPTPEEEDGANKEEPKLDPSAKYQPPKLDVDPPKTFGKKNASIPDWPNLTLVNQDGKQVKFYDDLIKGKTVVINFFYATCDGT